MVMIGSDKKKKRFNLSLFQKTTFNVGSSPEFGSRDIDKERRDANCIVSHSGEREKMC